MPEIAVFEILPAALAPPQAHSDAQLIQTWLHSRSVHTQRAYAADIARKPLPSVTASTEGLFTEWSEIQARRFGQSVSVAERKLVATAKSDAA
jgi:hypothetical protein